MDVFPTLLKIAGGDPDKYTLDGVDVLPVLTEGKKTPHDVIYWEMEDQTALRRGDYKLVLNGRLVEEEKPKEPVFLADLSKDPGETVNLAEKLPELTKALTEEALCWREKLEQHWEARFAAAYRSLT